MSEELAKRRFMLINLTRFGGVLLVMFGIATVRGVVGIPEWLGYPIAILGMFEIFFMPTLLARRWKTPSE